MSVKEQSTTGQASHRQRRKEEDSADVGGTLQNSTQMQAHLVSESDAVAGRSSPPALVHSEGSSEAPWDPVTQSTPSGFCCSTGESQHSQTHF